MTKNIHVVNGDESKWNVKVLVQDRVWPSEQKEEKWHTVKTIFINSPGQLSTEYITASRRLIIEEDGAR